MADEARCAARVNITRGGSKGGVWDARGGRQIGRDSLTEKLLTQSQKKKRQIWWVVKIVVSLYHNIILIN